MKEIALSPNQVALVDDDDYVDLAQYDWYLRKQKPDIRYAVRYEPQDGRGHRVILMHRQILGLAYGDNTVLTAHMNGNRLDNRRSNLRVCDRRHIARAQRRPQSQRSRYRGVQRTADGGWEARIKGGHGTSYLGRFEKEEQAALCYDKHAREWYGEFAVLNFPQVTEYDLPQTRKKPTSAFRGVSWESASHKWQVVIKRDGVTKHVGHFDDERIAALAYDRAARKLHGQSARLNFPEVQRYRIPKRKTSSKYRGVSRKKGRKRWTACIGVEGRTCHLGTFENETEAARAYDRAAVRYRVGATLNFTYTDAELRRMRA